MAGYMSKVVGADAIYEGAIPAGEALTNGLFCTVQSGTLKKAVAATALEMEVVEKTTLWGEPALRAVVRKPDGVSYFIEKVFDKTSGAYDDANIETAQGELARAHLPLIGEEAIFTVASALYSSLNAGDTITPAAGGTVAKKSNT